MGKLNEVIRAGGVYFIAEMSANHDNNLDTALAIVDAAAAAGADCLKVQTYTADTLTLDCDNGYFQIHGGLWDGQILYDLYKDASFPWEWHEAVRDRCRERGLDFLSTPFDETATDFLEELGVEAYKIASFELTDIPLLEYVAQKGKPVILSTGMSTVDEIGDAVAALRGAGCEDIILLRCCSKYPAMSEDFDLATIPDMVERFGTRVGFSDHSMGHMVDVVAASLGACVIEKHFCLSRDIKTADSEFSMTPEEYHAMVAAVNDAVAALGKPRYGVTNGEVANRMFRRSIFAAKDIKAGETFTKENIRIVRPSFGAKPVFYNQLLGTPSDREYRFGDPIVFEG